MAYYWLVAVGACRIFHTYQFVTCERMDLILNEFGFEHKFGKLEFLLAIMKYETSSVGKA